MGIEMVNSKKLQKRIKNFDDKLDIIIPTYIKNMDVKITFIYSKWDILKLYCSAFKNVLDNMYIGCDYYDLLSYFNTIPPKSEIYGMHMNAKGNNGEHLIYIYVNSILETCNKYDSDFEATVLVCILHELYHAFQEQYWVDFKELNDKYININIDNQGYKNQLLEVAARKWSLDRVNYCLGERFFSNY